MNVAEMFQSPTRTRRPLYAVAWVLACVIAAAALVALSGCSSAYLARSYHPTSAFPPTPTAEEAISVCRGELLNQYAGEETAANMGGAIGAATSGVFAREIASYNDCLRRHGYEHNS